MANSKPDITPTPKRPRTGGRADTTPSLQRIEGRIDLPPGQWVGWRIRGAYLIGPGGMRFNARALAAAWRHYVKAGLPGVDRLPSVADLHAHNHAEARPRI